MGKYVLEWIISMFTHAFLFLKQHQFNLDVAKVIRSLPYVSIETRNCYVNAHNHINKKDVLGIIAYALQVDTKS